MHESISIIARDQNGKLKIAYEHIDATQAAVDQMINGLKETGAVTVIVLLSDDSVFRHWTTPR